MRYLFAYFYGCIIIFIDFMLYRKILVFYRVSYDFIFLKGSILLACYMFLRFILIGGLYE